MHESFGYGERNSSRVVILNFAVAFDLAIVNSLFKKKENHLVTFMSGFAETQIEYCLIRANNKEDV